MSGYKNFADGFPLYESELDGYLMRQTIMRFPTRAALTAALGVAAGVREHGMMAWADDANGGGGCLYAFSGLLNAWVPWDSPMVTYLTQANSNSVNWTNGNATQFGQWRYSGGMVQWSSYYAVGSTSNLQTGSYAWAVPVNVHASMIDGYPCGLLGLKDASGPGPWLHRVVMPLGNAGFVAAISEAGTRVGTATPFAPSTGDIYSINARYQPAETVWLT